LSRILDASRGAISHNYRLNVIRYHNYKLNVIRDLSSMDTRA
jgi:hypothetical protein